MEPTAFASLFGLGLGLAVAAAAVMLLVWPVAQAGVAARPVVARKLRPGEDSGAFVFEYFLAILAVMAWGFLYLLSWGLAVSWIPWPAMDVIGGGTGGGIGAGGRAVGCLSELVVLGKLAAGIRAIYLAVKRGFFAGISSLALSLPLILVAGFVLVARGLPWALLFFLAVTTAGVSALLLLLTDLAGRSLRSEPAEEDLAEDPALAARPRGEDPPEEAAPAEDGEVNEVAEQEEMWPPPEIPWHEAQAALEAEEAELEGQEAVVIPESVDPPAEGPGEAALDAILEAAHPDQRPLLWREPMPEQLSGPLQQVAAYLVPGPRSHWHYVSYGFTNLHGTGPRPSGPVSGWGFELTFRLAATQKRPPAWPVELMQFLAFEVFKTHTPLAAGEFIDLGEPLPAKTETGLCAVGLVEDPNLGRGQSPFGPFLFLQLVGLHRDELDFATSWSVARFLKLAQVRDPLLVTDLKRPSWLSEAVFLEFAEAGREAAKKKE